jgi:hypothetical protein
VAKALCLAHLHKLPIGLQSGLGVDPLSWVGPRAYVERLPHGEEVFRLELIAVDLSERVLDPPGIASEQALLAAIVPNLIVHRPRSTAIGRALGPY